MSKYLNITIGPHFEDFIEQQIQNGRYGSASDTIHAALRLLEEKEIKLEALRRSLIEGEESGKAEYSLDNLIDELNRE
jgi:antitoxin ParD1/3/4